MGNLTGSQIQPQNPTSLYNAAYQQGGSVQQQQFLSDLAIMTMGNPQGGIGMMQGLGAYPGELSPNINQTILPSVYGGWGAQNQGTNYLGNYLGSPNAGGMLPAYQQAQTNIAQTGGIGGAPTNALLNALQYGGAGGVGNQGMNYMMQFGAPSQAGQSVSNIAQYGGYGNWGNMLQNRASGQGPSAAASYLTPFLMAKPYSPGWNPGGGR